MKAFKNYFYAILTVTELFEQYTGDINNHSYQYYIYILVNRSVLNVSVIQ